MPEVRSQMSEVSNAGSAGILPASSAAPSFIAIVADDSSLLTAHCQLPTDAPTETADCPICNESLPLVDFGIVRSRTSGRNLYCKSCIRKKVTHSRRALSYRPQIKKAQADLPLIGLASQRPELYENGVLRGDEIRNPARPHHDRVLGAIHQGARTQKEILHAIGGLCRTGAHNLAMDQVGDSLAVLRLNAPRKVKTEIVDGLRVWVPSGATTTGTAGGSPAMSAQREQIPSAPLSLHTGIMAPTSARPSVAGRRSAAKPLWRAA